MGLPLEKVYKLFGYEMRIQQVFDANNIVDLVDPNSFYFLQLPTSRPKILKQLSEKLPFMIPLQTPDWFFIHASDNTSFDEHVASLKASHSKKMRRYMKKPDKYGYSLTFQSARKFSADKLLRCHELLCQTIAYNGDTEFYTVSSFQAHLASLPDGVLVASRSDGRILGFYSGAVIGHDHSEEFRSWGVYHNLFIEYVKKEFRKGSSVIDLGNTNDDFKRELGGKPSTVMFELRTGASIRSALFLGYWGLSSMMQNILGLLGLDNFIIQNIQNRKRAQLLVYALCGAAVLLLLALVAQPVLKLRFWLQLSDDSI
eukprot:TRINITY_DN9017_c2_g1_i1.p1 TRINITY_DN9017_c2_g1~~TRINITY_DN9017_c2_g1_i1.p1  ORF type:complete len:314 (-),score=44.69 TRINITY_DN9017_c2_g1_i1:285-1226(-)